LGNQKSENLLKTDNQKKAMNRPSFTKEAKKNTAVAVPNKERERFKKQLEKQRLTESLTRALNEVKLMEEGKLPKPDINDLFKD
jgi:hypothetical protein